MRSQVCRKRRRTTSAAKAPSQGADKGARRAERVPHCRRLLDPALEPLLGESQGAKLAWKPATEVEVRGDDAATLMRLIDALEDDDDIQTVWGNYDVPDEELAKL